MPAAETPSLDEMKSRAAHAREAHHKTVKDIETTTKNIDELKVDIAAAAKEADEAGKAHAGAHDQLFEARGAQRKREAEASALRARAGHASLAAKAVQKEPTEENKYSSRQKLVDIMTQAVRDMGVATIDDELKAVIEHLAQGAQLKLAGHMQAAADKALQEAETYTKAIEDGRKAETAAMLAATTAKENSDNKRKRLGQLKDALRAKEKDLEILHIQAKAADSMANDSAKEIARLERKNGST